MSNVVDGDIERRQGLFLASKSFRHGIFDHATAPYFISESIDSLREDRVSFKRPPDFALSMQSEKDSAVKLHTEWGRGGPQFPF